MSFKDCKNTMDTLEKAIDDTKEYIDDTLVSYPTITEMNTAIENAIGDIPTQTSFNWVQATKSNEIIDTVNTVFSYNLLIVVNCVDTQNDTKVFYKFIPKGTPLYYKGTYNKKVEINMGVFNYREEHNKLPYTVYAEIDDPLGNNYAPNSSIRYVVGITTLSIVDGNIVINTTENYISGLSIIVFKDVSIENQNNSNGR